MLSLLLIALLYGASAKFQSMPVEIGVSIGLQSSSYTHRLELRTSDVVLPSVGISGGFRTQIGSKVDLNSSIMIRYSRGKLSSSNTNFIPETSIELNNRSREVKLSNVFTSLQAVLEYNAISDKFAPYLGLGVQVNISTGVKESLAGTDYYSTVLSPPGRPPTYRELDTPFQIDRESDYKVSDSDLSPMLVAGIRSTISDKSSISLSFFRFLNNGESDSLTHKYNISISYLYKL